MVSAGPRSGHGGRLRAGTVTARGLAETGIARSEVPAARAGCAGGTARLVTPPACRDDLGLRGGRLLVPAVRQAV
jgi:hypothetical protein